MKVIFVYFVTTTITKNTHESSVLPQIAPLVVYHNKIFLRSLKTHCFQEFWP